MHPFPHRYQVSSSGCPEGEVIVGAPGLQPLHTQAPIEFGGPGDRWSPESMLVGAMADCYLLTFRALARAARLEWLSLECTVEGVLDQAPEGARFTSYALRAHLVVPADADIDMAERALERAEERCLVSNSLRGERSLTTVVEVAAAAARAAMPAA